MKKYLRFAQAIGGLTIISRILGLVRDILCAALLGAGLVWDAFVLGWTIPNLFRRLFGEGALSSAFIPVFAKVREKEGLEKAFVIARITLTYFSLILLAIVLVFYLGGGVAYGFFSLPEKLALVIEILFVVMPYLLFICMAALLGAILNSLDSFALPAAIPVVLNIFWIGSLVGGYYLFDDRRHLVLFMCLFLTVGGIVQFFMLAVSLKKKGMKWAPKKDFSNPYLKEVKTLMMPVVWGLAAMQVNVLLDRLIAEGMVAGHGAVSALYYGNRLIQFPLAIIGIALATAIFPALSQQVVQKDTENFQKTLVWAVKMTVFIALPASLGLMILSEPTIVLFFQRGSFDAEAVRRTSLVLVYYCPSVFFYSLIHILSRAYYAHQNTKSPVRISTVMVVANLLLNLALVPFLEESGLALATSLSSLLNFLALWWYFNRQYEGLPGRELIAPFLRNLLGGVIMVITLAILLSYWPSPISTLFKLLRVLSLVTLGALVYLVITYLIGAREVEELWQSLQKD